MKYKNCLICYKNNECQIRKLALELPAWLDGALINSTFLPVEELTPEKASNAEFILSLGGDGTLLGVCRKIAGLNIPVLGINCGHLGFLCAAQISDWQEVLAALLENRLLPESYTGLSWVLTNTDVIQKQGIAINEVVMSRGCLARLIKLRVSIGAGKPFIFRGDGLICHSPLGSSGYNLSAGGPLIEPNLKNIGLTPVCAFSKSFSPLVVDAKTAVRFDNMDENSESFLTIDGQEGIALKTGDVVTVTGFPDAAILPGLRSIYSANLSKRLS